MGREYVAITDNADPMDVVVYRRGAHGHAAPRLVCTQPVFEQGASATDNSLIGTGRSLVVENNYGYSGPDRHDAGRDDARPGIERVDINDDGGRLPDASGAATRRARRWCRSCRSPPGSSTRTRSRRRRRHRRLVLHRDRLPHRPTVYKRLAGTGLGFNNNYAPVTLGPDGTAYVGALGGLVPLRDG